MGTVCQTLRRICDPQPEQELLKAKKEYADYSTNPSDSIRNYTMLGESQKEVERTYSILMEAKHAEFKRIVNTPECELRLIKQKPGLCIRGKATEHGFLLFAKFNIQKTATAFAQLYGNPVALARVDKNIQRMTIIEEGQTYCLTHVIMRKIFGFSQRDAVLCTRKFEDDNAIDIVSTSVEYPGYEPKDGVVRLKMQVGGVHIEGNDERCQVTYVSECDLGSSIPVVILKTAAAYSMKQFVQSIQHALEFN